MITNRAGLVLAYSGLLANGRIRKALAAHGLKPGHGHVLMLLSEQAPRSQQSLLEELGVDPSVLVAILNDLEGGGLAERRRDPADRRRHIVEISARGRKLVTQLDRAIGAVETDLFAGLDADEIETLRRLLTRIADTKASDTKASDGKASDGNTCGE